MKKQSIIFHISVNSSMQKMLRIKRNRPSCQIVILEKRNYGCFFPFCLLFLTFKNNDCISFGEKDYSIKIFHVAKCHNEMNGRAWMEEFEELDTYWIQLFN
jgi:hypothetical protein